MPTRCSQSQEARQRHLRQHGVAGQGLLQHVEGLALGGGHHARGFGRPGHHGVQRVAQGALFLDRVAPAQPAQHLPAGAQQQHGHQGQERRGQGQFVHVVGWMRPVFTRLSPETTARLRPVQPCRAGFA
jgi:hypothetical protein